MCDLCKLCGLPDCVYASCVYKPLVLEGEAARQFLADMEERDRRGNTPEHQAFLDECTQVYLKNQAQLNRA